MPDRAHRHLAGPGFGKMDVADARFALGDPHAAGSIHENAVDAGGVIIIVDVHGLVGRNGAALDAANLRPERINHVIGIRHECFGGARLGCEPDARRYGETRSGAFFGNELLQFRAAPPAAGIGIKQGKGVVFLTAHLHQFDRRDVHGDGLPQLPRAFGRVDAARAELDGPRLRDSDRKRAFGRGHLDGG